jgi:flagellar biosynthesis/type III secretory pathway protein FliH
MGLAANTERVAEFFKKFGVYVVEQEPIAEGLNELFNRAFEDGYELGYSKGFTEATEHFEPTTN